MHYLLVLALCLPLTVEASLGCAFDGRNDWLQSIRGSEGFSAKNILSKKAWLRELRSQPALMEAIALQAMVDGGKVGDLKDRDSILALDEDRRALVISRVTFRKPALKARTFYNVRFRASNTEAGEYAYLTYEVVGNLQAEARPLLALVARFNETTFDYCKGEFVVD